MARMWEERANYGHFFYRIPNGESAADAYDRISGFNESLWRSFGEEDFASVCVLVTHGLMTRVFLMKWYHFSVEYFEDLRNVNHCEFIVMRRNDSSGGKYILQNQLRTWSELRREQRMRERKESHAEPASPEIPVRKKWVGCREEDDQGDGVRRRVAGNKLPRRQNTADLFFEDTGGNSGSDGEDHAMQMPNTNGEPSTRQKSGTDNEGGRKSSIVNGSTSVIPSPSGFLTATTIRHAGRDGGGTLSGAGSEEEEEEEEEDTDSSSGGDARPRFKQQPPRRSLAMALKGDLLEQGDNELMISKADALGDQSDVDENSPTEMELRRMKRENQSFEGSVR